MGFYLVIFLEIPKKVFLLKYLSSNITVSKSLVKKRCDVEFHLALKGGSILGIIQATSTTFINEALVVNPRRFCTTNKSLCKWMILKPGSSSLRGNADALG